MALHAHVSHGGWTTGPLVAAVLRHTLTPSQSINQSIDLQDCTEDISQKPHFTFFPQRKRQILPFIHPRHYSEKKGQFECWTITAAQVGYWFGSLIFIRVQAGILTVTESLVYLFRVLCVTSTSNLGICEFHRISQGWPTGPVSGAAH
jgi:hypothetical protein